MMTIDAISVAKRFLGMKEVPGAVSNPAIVAMLQLDAKWPSSDDVAWCSAFVNFIAHLLGLPRSRSLAARSWLGIGKAVQLSEARPGFDVVVFSRGENSPGPTVLNATGHVAFFSGLHGDRVHVIGGNQNDAVTENSYPVSRVLGVRRLWEDLNADDTNDVGSDVPGGGA